MKTAAEIIAGVRADEVEGYRDGYRSGYADKLLGRRSELVTFASFADLANPYRSGYVAGYKAAQREGAPFLPGKSQFSPGAAR
jgi:hypothetical protein